MSKDQTAANRERLLQRFIRYVQVDTTADDTSDTVPSSPGQLNLGLMLVNELRSMGIADASQDSHGIVLGTLGGNVDRKVPVIAFNAHVDTSPETTGKGVRPQVWRDYPGGDIPLPGDPKKVVRVSENPELEALKGQTIITSDGTTLLGSDDKSGVAVIMEMANRLLEQPQRPRGPIKILFTCDEEVGHGVDHVDLKGLGATVCYTLDGGGADEINAETFSADLAIVTLTGINIHPSIGKGKMVNSVRGAADFLDRLPRETLSPESSEGREGFLHPYKMEGGVAQTRIQILLRDFDTDKLAEYRQILENAARQTELAFPGLGVNVQITKQYRNLGDGLKREPRAIELAVEAHRRLGRTPRMTLIRGGTDGSRMTELGLPAPNLSTGEHTPHSPLEWTCLEEMELAVDLLMELAAVWAEQSC